MLKVRFDHHTAHGVEMFLECTKTEGWEINGWHEGDELSAEAIVCYCPECDGVREEADPQPHPRTKVHGVERHGGGSRY